MSFLAACSDCEYQILETFCVIEAVVFGPELTGLGLEAAGLRLWAVVSTTSLQETEESSAGSRSWRGAWLVW